MLAAGLGVPAGAAVTAAAAYGLVAEGVLPGKYRLAQLLGACGSPPGPPRGELPSRHEEVFWSAYRRTTVRMVTLIPAQHAAPAQQAVPAAQARQAIPLAQAWQSVPAAQAQHSVPAARVQQAIPAAQARQAARAQPELAARLGVVVALHGLGSSALGAADLYAPAMAAAAAAPSR